MNIVHTHLTSNIFANASDAIDAGFFYDDTDDPKKQYKDVKPIRIERVVVVREGTQGRKPTLDFILQDETGQRYVFMITGALLKPLVG